MYGRHLLICDFDQAVAGGNAHAVVENLSEYAFGDFVEGMTGDAGLPSAEELKEVPRLAEATTEVVRPEMPECVGSQLMKLRIGDEI